MLWRVAAKNKKGVSRMAYAPHDFDRMSVTYGHGVVRLRSPPWVRQL